MPQKKKWLTNGRVEVLVAPSPLVKYAFTRPSKKDVFEFPGFKVFSSRLTHASSCATHQSMALPLRCTQCLLSCRRQLQDASLGEHSCGKVALTEGFTPALYWYLPGETVF